MTLARVRQRGGQLLERPLPNGVLHLRVIESAPADLPPAVVNELTSGDLTLYTVTIKEAIVITPSPLHA